MKPLFFKVITKADNEGWNHEPINSLVNINCLLRIGIIGNYLSINYKRIGDDTSIYGCKILGKMEELEKSIALQIANGSPILILADYGEVPGFSERIEAKEVEISKDIHIEYNQGQVELTYEVNGREAIGILELAKSRIEKALLEEYDGEDDDNY